MTRERKFPFFIKKRTLVEEIIKKELEKILNTERFESYYLVDLLFHKQINTVVVYIDGEVNVDFDICKKLSRELELFLDEKLILSNKYTLEVSSPGLDRPLKIKRQYFKNTGRSLDVKYKEKESSQIVKIQGILKEANEEYIVIERTIKKITELVKIEFEDIIQSKIIISFK